MNKIAVPVDGNQVSQHFGHCQQFCLVSVEHKEISKKEFVDNPGHQPGFLPGFLHELGVDCILAGGMGSRAINLFQSNGIKVVTGASGSVERVIDQYLNDNLVTEDNVCDH